MWPSTGTTGVAEVPRSTGLTVPVWEERDPSVRRAMQIDLGASLEVEDRSSEHLLLTELFYKNVIESF